MPELQATRGASLITAETSGSAHPSVGAGPRRATGLVLLVAVVGLTVDQLTKQLAVRELAGREPVDVVGELLQLRLLRNPGAAFSTGASLTPVITVVAIVAAVVVIRFALQVRHRVWAFALGLLLAGILGNLTDRMLRDPAPFRGHVVDFIALPRWPVFNVADICIDVAAAMFVVLLLRGERLDRSPRHGNDQEPSAGISDE